MSSARTTLLATLAVAALTAASIAPAALAAEAPEAPGLAIDSVATPTNFEPVQGEQKYSYELRIDNLGAAPTDGSPIKIVDTLPKGLSVAKIEFKLRYKQQASGKNFGEDPEVCGAETVSEVTTVTCTVPEELAGSGEESAVRFPAEEWRLAIYVNVNGLSNGTKLLNQARVEGGGSPAAETSSENEVSSTPAPSGIAQFSATYTGDDGQPVTEAGSHPYEVTTSFSFNTKHQTAALPGEPEIVPSGAGPKNTPIALPAGLIGNPTAVTRCTAQQFAAENLYLPPETSINSVFNDCPAGSAVGYLVVRRLVDAGTNVFPIYNLVPPPGMPAQLGFEANGLPFFIDTEARPSDDYKVVGVARNINQVSRVVAASVTLWGDPADPRHDPIRGGLCLNYATEELPAAFPASLKPECPISAGTQRPFLRMPTSCEGPLETTMSLDTWLEPGLFSAPKSSISAAMSGCNQLEFEPSLEARPTTEAADSPSGLDVDLHLPQEEGSGALGEADLRKAVVTLPRGVAVNPSSANGLGACSEAQVGFEELEADGTAIFGDEAAHCPVDSKLGTVEVDTPLLEAPLKGSVYAATPYQNPFGSLLALYIAVDDPERGVVVKLAGQVEADPGTGQLTTAFDQNPQLPFEDFKLHFFDGPGAALRTPAVCGAYSTTSQMTPWSAPESGPPATPSDTYPISHAPGGGSCPTSAAQEPNSPTFEAGTVSPTAGTYSPLVISLRRADGSQEFGSLTVIPPPGLLGRLVGIPYCPNSALSEAEHKSGREELGNPSCPVASEVGSVTAAAGAGPAPYYTKGRAYLAGPYKGAPLSLAIVTPATAGPYDLGTVVVRTALHVDPETARITAVSDPIPHILQGIPLDVRSIAVKIDRPNFILNPTNCEALNFAGQLTSTLGQAAPLSSRFQVGECKRLGFKPKLSLKLKGGTKRNKNPALTATVNYPQGTYANIARASVALPHSEFLDQSHIKTICTRVQFAEGAVPGEKCPAGSVYGFARATTPLLENPVEGPVYLRSSSHNLPDLVAALNGQIHVDLDGRIDTDKQDGIRSTFEVVPDAPVTQFTLKMQGGKKGLLVNSENICRKPQRATAKFTAQNGKTFNSNPLLQAQCGKPRGHKKHPHS